MHTPDFNDSSPSSSSSSSSPSSSSSSSSSSSLSPSSSSSSSSSSSNSSQGFEVDSYPSKTAKIIILKIRGLQMVFSKDSSSLVASPSVAMIWPGSTDKHPMPCPMNSYNAASMIKEKFLINGEQAFFQIGDVIETLINSGDFTGGIKSSPHIGMVRDHLKFVGKNFIEHALIHARHVHEVRQKLLVETMMSFRFFSFFPPGLLPLIASYHGCELIVKLEAQQKNVNELMEESNLDDSSSTSFNHSSRKSMISSFAHRFISNSRASVLSIRSSMSSTASTLLQGILELSSPGAQPEETCNDASGMTNLHRFRAS